MTEGNVFTLSTIAWGGGYPVPGPDRGGWYPIPGLDGGTPSQVWMEGCPIPGLGYPIPSLDGGYPIPGLDRRGTTAQVWTGGYHIPGLDGGTPSQVCMGGAPNQGLDGVPPHWDWMGYPPPNQDHREHLLHSGRYAPYVHAGLSCYTLILAKRPRSDT